MINQNESIQIEAVVDVLKNVLATQTYDSFRLSDLSATEVKEAIVTLLRIKLTCQSNQIL